MWFISWDNSCDDIAISKRLQDFLSVHQRQECCVPIPVWLEYKQVMCYASYSVNRFTKITQQGDCEHEYTRATLAPRETYLDFLLLRTGNEFEVQFQVQQKTESNLGQGLLGPARVAASIFPSVATSSCPPTTFPRAWSYENNHPHEFTPGSP